VITPDLIPMLDDAAFTDDDLAKLAEVPVELIKAARAKKAAVVAALEPPPVKRTRAKPAEAQPVAEEPIEVDAPASVRVTVGEKLIAVPGQRAPRRVAFRDVYGGDFAKFLWTNYRAIVEPYGV
jgi:hypothetical protein